MAERGAGAASASVVAGAASVLTLPIAIYLTRFSDSYDLLHAGFAIPVVAGLGIVAIVLARRTRRQAALSLSAERPGAGLARAGQVLGVLGLCIAASALVALGVYGLLEYVGSRE